MTHGDRLLALCGGIIGGGVVTVVWCVIGARVPAVVTVREVGLVICGALRRKGK